MDIIEKIKKTLLFPEDIKEFLIKSFSEGMLSEDMLLTLEKMLAEEEEKVVQIEEEKIKQIEELKTAEN